MSSLAEIDPIVSSPGRPHVPYFDRGRGDFVKAHAGADVIARHGTRNIGDIATNGGEETGNARALIAGDDLGCRR